LESSVNYHLDFPAISAKPIDIIHDNKALVLLHTVDLAFLMLGASPACPAVSMGNWRPNCSD
jgi:hypothetical protein